MSADNGYLLRRNTAGEYVLQMYFASADQYPSIDALDRLVFHTLEEAALWYETHNPYSEYGLTIKCITPTAPYVEPKEGEG
jgi:hypothetical protein